MCWGMDNLLDTRGTRCVLRYKLILTQEEIKNMYRRLENFAIKIILRLRATAKI